MDTKAKAVDALLKLAREACKNGWYSDKRGEFVPLFYNGNPTSSWYSKTEIRLNTDGTYLFERYSHFKHSAADIPFHENDEWPEMPKPWWEVKKVASVSVCSLDQFTPKEKKQIEDELFGDQ